MNRLFFVWACIVDFCERVTVVSANKLLLVPASSNN
jgi:hypothetical protein